MPSVLLTLAALTTSALAAPPITFTVSPSNAAPGDTVTLDISNAPPRTNVYVGLSARAASPDAFCPAALGGECLDLAAPVQTILTARSSATGTLTREITLPATAHTGRFTLQAAAPLTGEAAAVSNTATLTIASCTPTSWYADDDLDGYGDADAAVSACDAPDGYVADAADCDDADAAVSPAAAEACNDVDDDCDGAVDEGLDTSWYLDSDDDGYGDADAAVSDCAEPAGYVADATDCDDADAAVSPAAAEACNSVDDDCDGAVDDGLDTSWYLDSDEDGYGDAAQVTAACAAPAGYVADATDCDDSSAAAHPGGTESCNGADDDCDGVADEGLEQLWFADDDQDGYGDAADSQAVCAAPAGYVADATDCDDADAAVSPAATETCDGADQDCDGVADEGLEQLWFADADDDGYGDPTDTQSTCAAPSGYVANGDDCDDASTSVSPATAESCNGADDDCDGVADEGLDAVWFLDADSDGYGDPASWIAQCATPSGYASNAEDCDDGAAGDHPGADEACDGEDNDCDGLIDDGLTTQAWPIDADDDGYGDPASSVVACAPPTGATDNDWDCDDADGAVYPGVGCWFRMSYRGHAQATAYIVAGYAGTASYTCSNGGTATRTFSADSTASYGVSADSTCEVRSNVPFLTSIRPDNSWAEGTTLLRATDGSHLGTTLYGQGMGYVYVRNPSDADVAVTLASRSGSTWSTVSSGTVPAWGWLRLTTSFATSRLTADAPVLAYSSTDVQEQDQEYLVTDDGELVGTTFHYYSQESTRHDLLAQCVDPAGCFVAHFSNGAYATSAILDLGEYATFTSLTASVDHAVTSSGWMTVRAEGRATSTTSVPTDGTRVPGTSGEQRDVEHVFMTSAGGENNTFTDRFTDIYLYAYTEDTVVVIEELSGGAWSTVDTVILGVGEASHWGVALAPKRVFRTTASAPIDVELFGYGWEYSWTAFTDAPTAD